jgi:N-acetylmuramoyl-L-alanine amidase
VYYEARGEPRRGQLAVAEVVANRVRSRAYPNTFCGVVYQRSARVCQFSWACDRRAAPRGAAWASARSIAEEVVAGSDPDVVGNATHFHATSVAPPWARVYRRVARIGSHVFYSSGR